MDLVVSQVQFADSLKAIQGALAARQTIPILSDVLLSADAAGLTVIATDTEILLSARCPATVREVGTVPMPAKKLITLVGSLHDEIAIVTPKKQSAVMSSIGFKWQTATQPAEEYPLLPNDREYRPAFEFQPGKFTRLLHAVAQISDDAGAARYHTRGVQLTCGTQQLKCVATDGHRLVVIEIPATATTEFAGRLSQRGAAELAKLGSVEDDVVSCGDSETHLKFACGSRELYVTKIHDGFPAYERVIPKRSTSVVTVDRLALIEALTRARVLSDKLVNRVEINVTAGQIALAFTHSTSGDTNETIAADYAGAPFTILADVNYIVESLTALVEPSVTLGWQDELSPIVVKPVAPAGYSYLCVISQMRRM